MKPRIFLALLLCLCLFLPSASAFGPQYPDLPGFSVIDETSYNGVRRMLMQSSSGETVFVGGVRQPDDVWIFTVSAPLPAGSSLGRDGELLLPVSGSSLTVTLSPFLDGIWGVTLIESQGSRIARLSRSGFRSDADSMMEGLCDHPWNNITQINWSTLPLTYRDGLPLVDQSVWAYVSADSGAPEAIPLYARPSASSKSVARYYSGSPARILQQDGDWSQIAVGNVTGWLQSEYLAPAASNAFISFHTPIGYAAKVVPLYTDPDQKSPFSVAGIDTTFYLLSMPNPDWAHVWIAETGEYAYIRTRDFTYADG